MDSLEEGEASCSSDAIVGSAEVEDTRAEVEDSQSEHDFVGSAEDAQAEVEDSRSEPEIRDELWERLFKADCHGLTWSLSTAEFRRCRGVCSRWRHLAQDTATPEELWHYDLGAARRGAAWKELLLGGITLQAKSPKESYYTLCQTSSQYDSVIRRDVNRTLPQEEHFKEKNGQGQTMLFRVLHAIAIRLWDIGYCQSLNFIVATLIGVFPDDEPAVFHCALALLLRHSLVDQYRPSFAKLGVTVWQFDKIVEAFLPKVHDVLQAHGVNAEYYAIQWFLTLFASDLPQPTVRRIWDRFLVAGWQVVVQVALALLYAVQDDLPQLDNCEALTFLRKLARANDYSAEDLLQKAASFRVSHRMLSALEAAYSWEGEVQLFVAKDLNSGQVHWTVQAVPVRTSSNARSEQGGDDDTPVTPMPRAFSRSSTGGSATPKSEGGAAGDVLPFLVHNLDTGETSVMERAWHRYQREHRTRAQAKAATVKVSPTPGMPKPAVGSPPPPPAQRQNESGSFWTQSMQRQASRRLNQA